MLTIQADIAGKWTNVVDHHCETEAQMQEYITAFGGEDIAYMRIADPITEGEETHIPHASAPLFETHQRDEAPVDQQHLAAALKDVIQHLN